MRLVLLCLVSLQTANRSRLRHNGPQHLPAGTCWLAAIMSHEPGPLRRIRTTPRAARAGTTSQLDRSDFQSIMGSYEGAFSAEPAAGDHPRGLVRPGEPVVGSPTHPVMPNLVMLWTLENESPAGRSAGGCQVVGAGARLWARGPARRGWVAIGPKPKPRGAGAGGAPGPLRGEGRRPAQGHLFSPIISRVREPQQALHG
jgi:hypothetical protein